MEESPEERPVHDTRRDSTILSEAPNFYGSACVRARSTPSSRHQSSEVSQSKLFNSFRHWCIVGLLHVQIARRASAVWFQPIGVERDRKRSGEEVKHNKFICLGILRAAGRSSRLASLLGLRNQK